MNKIILPAMGAILGTVVCWIIIGMFQIKADTAYNIHHVIGCYFFSIGVFTFIGILLIKTDSGKLMVMEGKTVIHFTTHGCMGTEHEFDYIGTIVGKVYPPIGDGKLFYKIKVLKSKKWELRDHPDKPEYESVASWYLQDLGGDFYIAYD